jgi:perosamine synthetase
VVVTHSEEEWQLLRSLRNQGRTYDTGAWFDHVRLGFNYRWTDIQAAIGIGQLEKLDRILELRAAAAARYGELLAAVDGVETPLADDPDHTRSWFVYVVIGAGASVTPWGKSPREGIGTANTFLGAPEPFMREQYGFREGMFPVAEDACSRTLALPFYSQIAPADQERVVEALQASL